MRWNGPVRENSLLWEREKVERGKNNGKKPAGTPPTADRRTSDPAMAHPEEDGHEKVNDSCLYFRRFGQRWKVFLLSRMGCAPVLPPPLWKAHGLGIIRFPSIDATPFGAQIVSAGDKGIMDWTARPIPQKSCLPQNTRFDLYTLKGSRIRQVYDPAWPNIRGLIRPTQSSGGRPVLSGMPPMVSTGVG